MTTATTTALAVPDAAELLAALLPTRRNQPWTSTPAQHGMRPGAPCARLTDGRRSLLVVQADAARLEVFAEYPESYPHTPDAVAELTHDGVASVGALLLRCVLPRLDREIDAITARAPGNGWNHVLRHRMKDLTELGFTLIAHGAHPEAMGADLPVPCLMWTAERGGTWGVSLLGTSANLSLRYDGPVSGLYGVLPHLLPSAEGREPADVGSAFTRHLTDRFPQLLPVGPDEVMLPGYREPCGSIALSEKAVPTDHADDQTRVVADFGSLGFDLLLAAAPHLI